MSKREMDKLFAEIDSLFSRLHKKLKMKKPQNHNIALRIRILLDKN